MIEIDIEICIKEVGKFPDIWNCGKEEYHDKTKDEGAWMQLFSLLLDSVVK